MQREIETAEKLKEETPVQSFPVNASADFSTINETINPTPANRLLRPLLLPLVAIVAGLALIAASPAIS